MRINQGYFFVLLAFLSATCTSDCPTKTPYSLAQPAYDECTKLYSILETELLNNSVNLFKLHDILFPRSSSEPNYAMATFHSKVEEYCWYNPDKCYHTCWTSSLLLRSVDPSVLTTIQLQLLNVLLQTVGATELTDSCVRIDLELNINFTETDYKSNNMITEVLQDLTAWVSILLYLY